MKSIVSGKKVFEKINELINIVDYRDPFKDHKAKKLTTGSALALLIEAQLNERSTLEDVSENLRANEEWQSFVGLEDIHPSSIYRKLEKLDTRSLHQLAMHFLNDIDKDVSKKPNKKEGNLGPLHLIDGSEFSLSERDRHWAHVQKDRTSVKLHLCYVVNPEKDEKYAKDLVLSTAGFSEKEIARDDLVKDHNATYVFDRGYLWYHLYHSWIKKQIHFVARVQQSIRYQTVEEHPVSQDSFVEHDKTVLLKDAQEDVHYETRLVIYRDKENKRYFVVTNRWDLSAEEVAEIYRTRWQIEIFFKWIKQHFHLVRFYSHKPEAVWAQIYAAIIAYGLVKQIQREEQTNLTDAQVLRKIRHYWYRPWENFREELHRQPNHTSKGRRKKGRPGRPRKHPKLYKQQRMKSI